MKNQLIKITSLSILASAMLCAGGYKITTSSVNSVALGGASIAHSISADAAYYNAANMSFLENKNLFEFNLAYLGLSATNYKGTVTGDATIHNIDAESDSSIIPSIYFISEEIKGIRLGLSITVPAGSSKKWSVFPAVYSAKEFSLKAIEMNPTLSYKIADNISIAAGIRVISSSGIVESSASASRELEGNSMDYGYNLALSYKPTPTLDIGLTYRSNVDLTQEGNAKLYIGNTKVYDGGASVSVPLPTEYRMAIAYTLPSKTTLEFVYERTIWSSYSELDFNYVSAIPLILQSSFDSPIAKDWKDVSAYRFGITQEYDKMIVMAGFVYDESPIPNSTLSFEVPGSDSLTYSLGSRYEVNSDLSVGLSGLYSMKKDRTVDNDALDGEFTNTNVILIVTGVEYKF